MTNLFRRLYANPYVVLPLASLMWAGNSIIGRLAVGEITPMTLTCLRWVFVCALLATFSRRQALAALPALRGRWLWVVAMAALGYTTFNAMLYLAAYHTTAVNLTMLQAGVPVLVLLGGALFFGARVAGLQALGTALTLAGIAIVASHGDLTRLAGLELNRGDVYMMIACLCYAGYTLGLRYRPDLPGLSLFCWFAVTAMVTALPLLGWEIATGGFYWPSLWGWVILAYVVVCPSMLSQLFYMRGVELIGPGRAGLFINLIPIFGAALAVLMLGEPFGADKALAAALVLAGIALAEWGKRG